jgi:TRAP-type C4-dicarboxylate transport system substrate-binding protein
MKGKRAIVCIGLSALLVLGLFLGACSQGPAGEAPKAAGGTKEAAAAKPAGKAIQWSFFSAYGPEDGACCVVWPRLFKEIEQATGGQLVITPFWSGQHPYEGKDMLKVLKDGEAQLVHFYGGYLTAVEPVFGIDAVPMILPPDPIMAFKTVARLWGNFQQDRGGVLEDMLESRWNSSMVHMLPASAQRFFTKGYAAEGIGSFKGHKVRVYSPELSKLVEIMGGTPVSVSFGEVYTSLSTNLIDGTVTSTAFADSGGWFDYIDTINMWEIMAGIDGLAVSLKALGELPADVKAAFLKIMQESAMKPEMLELNDNAVVLEKHLLSGKVKAFVPKAEARGKVMAAVEKEIWAPWLAKTGEEGKKVLAQIEELKKELAKK